MRAWFGRSSSSCSHFYLTLFRVSLSSFFDPIPALFSWVLHLLSVFIWTFVVEDTIPYFPSPSLSCFWIKQKSKRYIRYNHHVNNNKNNNNRNRLLCRWFAAHLFHWRYLSTTFIALLVTDRSGTVGGNGTQFAHHCRYHWRCVEDFVSTRLLCNTTAKRRKVFGADL